MAGFQEKFRHTFFSLLANTLADERVLKTALEGFVKRGDPARYQCRETFAVTQWSDEDVSRLSAAVFEALCNASMAYMYEENAASLIHAYSEAIKQVEIPCFTEGLDPATDPLVGFRDKIVQYLEHPPGLQVTEEPVYGYGYACLRGAGRFFKPLATIAAVTAVAAAGYVFSGGQSKSSP